jgi:hypothetical protein
MPISLTFEGDEIWERAKVGSWSRSTPVRILKGTNMKGNFEHERKSHPFRFLTSVAVKSAVFWVVTPYSSEGTWRFGWLDNFHLQVRKISEARNQQKQVASSALTLPHTSSGLFDLITEAICSSEISGAPRTTRPYNQDRALHNIIYFVFQGFVYFNNYIVPLIA